MDGDGDDLLLEFACVNGGGGTLLAGDLIELQFLGNSYNYNLGSAMSLVLMVIVLLCMSFTSGFDDQDMEGVL